MFGSSSDSRLDLNIIVGPEKRGQIKTILSGHLPILIDYAYSYQLRDVTGSAIWRMLAALEHRDRVREISFGGSGVTLGKFLKATSHHFPALESLFLVFPHGNEPEIPATFLRGPDQSYLRLRHLTLYNVSDAYVSVLLLSATALTDLTLTVSLSATGFDPSQGSFLLACLQNMQCLRSLDLTTEYTFRDFPSQHSYLTPKDTVPFLKLTRFSYTGPTTFLNSFMSGFSAPSLKNAYFFLFNNFPPLYLSRVIDDVGEEFRSVSVSFDMDHFCLVSSTRSGGIDHFNFKTPSFRFHMYSINSINPRSTKLAMAEELALEISSPDMTKWDDVFSLREFLRQFRSVRVLRVKPFVREVGLCLRRNLNNGEAVFPVLEEVQLSISGLTRLSDEEYQRRAAEELADFEPCESMRVAL